MWFIPSFGQVWQACELYLIKVNLIMADFPPTFYH